MYSKLFIQINSLILHAKGADFSSKMVVVNASYYAY